MLGQPVHDRFEMEGGFASPIGQCRAMNVDTGAGQDLALPVERTVIGVFGHQHMSDGGLGRQSTLDQMSRSRQLGDAIRAGPAGIFGPHGHDHTQLRGHDVQPFAAILADPVHLSAAAGALKTVGFDDLFNARQVIGKVANVAPCSGLRPLFGPLGESRCFFSGLDLAGGGLKVFKRQLPLVFAQFLRPLAMNRMVQFRDQMLQAFVDVLELGHFAHQCGDSAALLQRDGGKVDIRGERHAPNIPWAAQESA